jgi:hypothetical protein
MTDLYPDAPALEVEVPDEEYACSHPPCTQVFTGPDAGNDLGSHEVEHIEGE